MSELRRQSWTFRATLDEHGKIHPEQAGAVRARLSRWVKRHVYFTVALERKRRSLTANAYQWVCYEYVADWSGHDPREIHAYLKDKYCPETELVLPTGESVRIKSTRRLDSAQHAEYVSQIKRWAAEQGVYIPEPGEMEQPL